MMTREARTAQIIAILSVFAPSSRKQLIATTPITDSTRESIKKLRIRDILGSSSSRSAGLFGGQLYRGGHHQCGTGQRMMIANTDERLLGFRDGLLRTPQCHQGGNGFHIAGSSPDRQAVLNG